MNRDQRNKTNRSKQKPKKQRQRKTNSTQQNQRTGPSRIDRLCEIADVDIDRKDGREPSLSNMMLSGIENGNRGRDRRFESHVPTKKRRMEISSSSSFSNVPKKVVRFENPERMGTRKLLPDKNVADAKDKRGASLAFREKYNQYLDSRMEKDDLDVDLVKNLSPEDLYSRNEDDMSDDEKQARFYFEENVDATVEKYKKMFESRRKEKISTVEKRKKIEKEKESELRTTFNVTEDGENDYENFVELAGDRANCVEVVKKIVVLDKPFVGSTSSLSSRSFVELEVNTNPYPFLRNWMQIQGPRCKENALTIICVQLDSFVKTKVEGFKVFKNFFTSTRFLTLNMFFGGLKSVPISVVPKNSAKKKRSNDESESESEEENEFDVEDTYKLDAIEKYNDIIEKGCEFNAKQTYHPMSYDTYNESYKKETATTTTTTVDVVTSSTNVEDGDSEEEIFEYHCNLACATFEKTFLSEDLSIVIYVYYKLDLKERKISIDRVFYILINLR
jgi:hypothetical protein